MSEKKRKVLETFERILPDASDLEVEKLLSFGDGYAFRIDREKQQQMEDACHE